MRRVKDYNTFLKENDEQNAKVLNALTTHAASKNMAKIIDPDSTRKVTVKNQDEIEKSFSADGTAKVWDAFIWNEEKSGFIGKSPVFSGEVILKEFDDDGSVVRKYEVTSGTNKGESGNFSWSGETADSEGIIKKFPVFDNPSGKKWSDLLGPDENFLKTFVSVGYRWGSNISEIDGIKFIKAGLKGDYEIEYDDKFQFFGKVKIYYLGNTGSDFFNSYYSYEVISGPNKGTKGTGLWIFTPEQASARSGISNPFSNGIPTLNVAQYPVISNNPDKSLYDLILANSINTSVDGVNPNQLIFFNTSDLSSIKGPTKEIFEVLYGSIENYNENKAYASMKNKPGNIILGKIEKSKLSTTQIYALQDTKDPVFFKGSAFPSLDGNETSECYISHYQGHPLILYTVKCEKRDKPSFDNKGIGTYGNNFFVGNFYDFSKDSSYQVRGEWYYDYSLDQIGILYAYSVSDKKEVTGITNPLSLIKRAIEKPDFTNPLDKRNGGIIKDQSGGSWPTPIKPKELKIPSIDDYFKKK